MENYIGSVTFKQGVGTEGEKGKSSALLLLSSAGGGGIS